MVLVSWYYVSFMIVIYLVYYMTDLLVVYHQLKQHMKGKWIDGMDEWTNRCIYGYINRYNSVIHIILSLYIVSCTHVMVSYINSYLVG